VQALDPARRAQPRTIEHAQRGELARRAPPPYSFLIRSRAASARTAIVNVSSSP
jgi:hypothetical protein